MNSCKQKHHLQHLNSEIIFLKVQQHSKSHIIYTIFKSHFETKVQVIK